MAGSPPSRGETSTPTNMLQFPILRLTAALALVASAGIAPLSAQLGALPADEWAITLESGRRLERLDIENVVARMNLQSGDVVADIGAGTGVFTLPIARVVGDIGTVYGVEVDPAFLPMIDRKMHPRGIHHVVPVLGEFADPKLPTRNVDVAFLHDTLHHIEGREAYLRTLAGYMAPGSRIVVVDYDMNHPDAAHRDDPTMLISQEMVTKWMRGAGFELREEVDLFDEKFYVIYQKVQ